MATLNSGFYSIFTGISVLIGAMGDYQTASGNTVDVDAKLTVGTTTGPYGVVIGGWSDVADNNRITLNQVTVAGGLGGEGYVGKRRGVAGKALFGVSF